MLEQPFDSKYIKQRKGRNNTTLDYLETHIVIQRLNDSFDGNWSFEIVSHEKIGEEIVVLGRMTAEGITKQQFGSSNIARAKSTNEIICIGDDMKSAASDALKKCATLFGIGLHLYGELIQSDDVSDKEDNTDKAISKDDKDKPKTNMENMTGNLGNNLITKEQLAQIKKLRTQHKLSVEDVQDKCKRMFGTTDVTALNTIMATALIAVIGNGNNGGNGSK